METSDSEYFESADEDFRSDDDEMQIKQKRDVKSGETKELVTRVKEVRISDKSNECKYEETGNKEGRNKKIDDDLACQTPPMRTECWEPGMDYDIKENKKESRSDCKREIEDGNEGSVLSDDSKHHLPSAVSSGGFDGTKQPQTKGSECEIKPKRPEFGIPPARTTCWVPGTSNVQQPFEPHPAYLELMKKKNQEQKSDLDTTRESGATISMVCKNSGVTKENRDGETPQELGATHTTKNSETIKEVNRQEKSDLEPPEELDTRTIRDSKATIKGKTQEARADSEAAQKSGNIHSKTTNDEDSEENMWENDDWGDFDAPVTIIDKSPKFKKANIKPPEKLGIEDNDFHADWEPVETYDHPNVTDPSKPETSTWGSWGNWGLTSVINTATTLTSQVSQGITNVLETGIGAPDPVELARIHKLEKEKLQEINVTNQQSQSEKPILGFGLGNLMQLVETTGTKVISGGLDTLETIGKKTMEVLQENDPGLKKKRAFLKLDDDKPILSQLLREAKEKAEIENKELERKHFARKANYETLFDDHQGLVHLEALEMLSKQCDIKLQTLLEAASGDALNEMQETLDQVKELCELPEEDEDENLSTEEICERLESAVSEINVRISYARLISTWREAEDWLAKLNLGVCSKNELHQQAIESLAQLTAIAVEQFHKTGELLLIKDHRSTADEADSLVQLTTTLTTLVGIVAARFSEKLNTIAVNGSEKEEVNSLITNVFLEAANSSSYIQDAFQLLISVLQVGAV